MGIKQQQPRQDPQQILQHPIVPTWNISPKNLYGIFSEINEKERKNDRKISPIWRKIATKLSFLLNN